MSSTGCRGAGATRPLREGQPAGIGSGVRGAPRTPSGDEVPPPFTLNSSYIAEISRVSA